MGDLDDDPSQSSQSSPLGRPPLPPSATSVPQQPSSLVKSLHFFFEYLNKFINISIRFPRAKISNSLRNRQNVLRLSLAIAIATASPPMRPSDGYAERSRRSRPDSPRRRLNGGRRETSYSTNSFEGSNSLPPPVEAQVIAGEDDRSVKVRLQTWVQIRSRPTLKCWKLKESGSRSSRRRFEKCCRCSGLLTKW